MQQQSKFITDRWVFSFTLFAQIQYILLTIVAMLFYPGSTHSNMETKGYIFSQNFLSDLGRYEVFNGEDNYVGAVLYFWSLLCLGAAVVLFFITIKDKFKGKLWTKILCYLMAFSGVVAGMGLIGIACVPANTFYDMHVNCVGIAFMGLSVTVFLYMINIYGTPSYPNYLGHIILALNIVLIGYTAYLLTTRPPVDSVAELTTRVTAQKIIVYLLIGILGYEAWKAKQLFTKDQ